MLKNEENEAVNLLQNLYQEARELLAKAVQSYADGDAQIAVQVIEDELKVSKIYKKTSKSLTKMLEDSTDNQRPIPRSCFWPIY